MFRRTKHRLGAGFTLVELLVVVAVMSILAAIMLAVLDPAKKNKQARDASRKSSMAQIAGGISDFFVTKGFYTESLANLTPDELKVVPKTPSGGDYFYGASNGLGGSCTTEGKNCTKAVLYDVYESPKTPCASGTSYWAWTSSSGRLGKICTTLTPSADEVPVDDL